MHEMENRLAPGLGAARLLHRPSLVEANAEIRGRVCRNVPVRGEQALRAREQEGEVQSECIAADALLGQTADACLQRHVTAVETQGENALRREQCVVGLACRDECQRGQFAILRKRQTGRLERIRIAFANIPRREGPVGCKMDEPSTQVQVGQGVDCCVLAGERYAG